MWEDRLLSHIMVGWASQSQIPLISGKRSAFLLYTIKDSRGNQLTSPKSTVINHKNINFIIGVIQQFASFLRYLSSEQLVYENFILLQYYSEVYNKKCCLKKSKNCLNLIALNLHSVFQNLCKRYSSSSQQTKCFILNISETATCCFNNNILGFSVLLRHGTILVKTACAYSCSLQLDWVELHCLELKG